MADDGGEETELAGGAGAFAFQAQAGQAGFSHGAFDEGVAEGEDFFGDGFEERGARF